jgi:membrane associated rhomboid family serine protease
MIAAPVGHHCPTCVGEARRDFGGSPAQQARKLARMSGTRLLLYALAAVYVVEIILSKGDALTVSFSSPSPRFAKTLFDMGAAFPPAIAGGQWWRLLTAMFLHLGLLHLALNAYALWIFGQFVELSFGRWGILLLFLLTGFLGSVASYMFGIGGVGASGAISGLFGAFIIYNFRRRHTLLAQGNLRLAASLIILNALLAIGVSNIDWRAHVGGLVAGVAAGAFLEGFGPRQWRPAIRVVGIVALVGLGIALTAARTAALHHGASL